MKNENLSVIWAGFDIGKKTFSAALDMPDENFKKTSVSSLVVKDFHRTIKGFERFLSWKQQQLKLRNFDDVPVSILMETTGCYSKELAKIISSKYPEYKVVIENASLINSFKKSLNIHNETDQLDAKAIARYGTERQPVPQAELPSYYQDLREMKRCRDDLVRTITALTNVQDSLTNQFARSANFRSIQAMNRQREMLETQIKKLVEKHEDLDRAVRILSSFPGVGFLSAMSILAEVGPLERFKTSRAFSAATGLAPQQKQSGTSINKSRISRKGSPELRQILYMISITAVRREITIGQFYEHLKSKGKKPMQCRVACMRKIATILRAMIVNGKSYEENYKKDTLVA